jgi:alkaline phosphatase D
LLGGTNETAIYHAFTVGRARFIVTDLRSERDDVRKKDEPGKTMMGSRQKKWFKQELLSARDKYPLIFWVCSVPWLGDAHTNYYRVASNHFGFIHHSQLTNQPVSTTRTNRADRATRSDQDHWSVFSVERREIADFIKSNHITGLCILHGDAHMLGADDGTHGDYATGGGVRIPVMCGGPLDQTASLKGGPYSQGVYRMQKGEGGFGFVTVTDKGDEIVVQYSGRNHKNDEKISLQFSVPATRTVAHRKPNG